MKLEIQFLLLKIHHHQSHSNRHLYNDCIRYTISINIAIITFTTCEDLDLELVLAVPIFGVHPDSTLEMAESEDSDEFSTERGEVILVVTAVSREGVNNVLQEEADKL